MRFLQPTHRVLVDLAGIEPATLSCEDSGIPLTYRPECSVASNATETFDVSLYQMSYRPRCATSNVATAYDAVDPRGIATVLELRSVRGAPYRAMLWYWANPLEYPCGP